MCPACSAYHLRVIKLAGAPGGRADAYEAVCLDGLNTPPPWLTSDKKVCADFWAPTCNKYSYT